ncbi:hypothetical protein H8E77_41605 [bacterium]|nr:hypothetical protein [bacterium]
MVRGEDNLTLGESLDDRVENLGQHRRKRGEMSNEGKEVYEMTEEELQELNERWVYWMNKYEHTLRWYAWGDDDLTQVGIINLRRTLCEDIDAPPNYLLHRARFAIWMASSYGRSVDSRKSNNQNQRVRHGGIKIIHTDGFDNPYDNPLLSDELKYNPEVLAIDQIAYNDFMTDLTSEESELLGLMIETKYNGKRGPGSFRSQFIQKTGSTHSNYEVVLMSVRRKYYYHYGTDYDREEFESFNRNWRPRMPMFQPSRTR